MTYRALKAIFLKGGKKRAIASRMGLVLYLIGREADVRSLDQSQSEVKESQPNPGFF